MSMASSTSSTFTLQAPPPDDWLEAGRQRDRALSALERHIDRTLDGFLRDVETELWTPMREQARLCNETHERTLADHEIPFGRYIDPSEIDRPLWEKLRAYRDETNEHVLAPLKARLEHLDPGHRITEMWRQARVRLYTIHSICPEVLVCPEPEGLYDPEGDDRLLRRSRKSTIRMGRALARARVQSLNAARAVFRKPALQIAPKDQHIPLRALATYHVRARLNEPWLELLETLQQHLAAPLAHLERILTAWSQELLELEWKMNVPAYHIDPSLPLSPPGTDALSPADLPADKPAPRADLASDAGKALDKIGTLRAVLTSMSSLEDSEKIRQDLSKKTLAAFEALRADVRKIGTFMLDVSERTLPPEGPLLQEKTQKRISAWATWYRRATARLRFIEDQIHFAQHLESLEETTIDSLYNEAVQPALEAAATTRENLNALTEEAEQVFSAHSADSRACSRAVTDMLGKALQTIETDFVGALDQYTLSEKTRSITERCAGEVLQHIHALNDQYTINTLQDVDVRRVNPLIDDRDVPLRQLGENAWNALLIERIRVAHTPLSQALNETVGAAREIPTIVRFNLEAAVEELAQADPGTPDEDAAPISASRELTIGGLTRSADAVKASTDNLGPALFEAASRIDKAYNEGWVQLHNRIGLEGFMQEQFVDVLTRLRGRALETYDTSKDLARKGWYRLLSTFRLGRRQAKALVQMGQTALGVADRSEVEFRETLEAIVELDALLEGLPLVYKRLFSFRPVTDPALLIGRERDLELVSTQLNQWKRGHANGLIIVGPYGSGHTSFLNVLRSEVLEGTAKHAIEIDERWTGEEAFAARVVTALKLDPSLESLREIRDHLTAQEPPEPPVVLTIEHLEHLLLRTIGGTNLVERILTFISRTDNRIFWIVTVTDYGWQLIEKTESAASKLVRHHTLTPYNRRSLEMLILNRHRRSGIPLHFEMPAEPSTLLKRKLTKAKNEDERQELLKENYFDRLVQICGQNVMLALFYWLRSIRLDRNDQLLYVRPARALSFSFLDEFGLNHAFTLKAFLEHASLTVPEHSAIFNMRDEESLEIFEALGNHFLIQQTHGFDKLQAAAHPLDSTLIDETARYRIRPLLIHPITQYLRSKNIVY